MQVIPLHSQSDFAHFQGKFPDRIVKWTMILGVRTLTFS